MSHLSKVFLALMLTNVLSACSMVGDDVANIEKNKEHTHEHQTNSSHASLPEQRLLQESTALNKGSSFTTKYRHLLKQNQLREQQIKKLEHQQAHINEQQKPANQDLNFYVRRLMQDLVSNLQFVNDKTPVAVTDFAFLDGDLQTTNLLGYQITESLTHEVHKFGIPVIDFKSTGFIRVTDNGDFLLTRNYEEISGNLPIRYVFTGTLTKHEKGYLVNAKVLGVESKAIVGSAQSFIPNSVAESLLTTAVENEPENKTIVAISN